MKTFFLSVSLLILVVVSHAQTIERAVISPCGAYKEMGLFSLSYTLSQTAIQTVNTGNNILTEGFQQPEDFFSAINEIKVNDLLISVYPNPAPEFIHVNLKGKNEGIIYIQVLNMLGEDVLGRISVSTDTDNIINLSTVEPGTYMVKVTGSGFTNALMFLKTHN